MSTQNRHHQPPLSPSSFNLVDVDPRPSSFESSGIVQQEREGSISVQDKQKGIWTALPRILYGVVVLEFVPTQGRGDQEEDEREIAQVPLEIGDEVYLFEYYTPPSPSSTTSSFPLLSPSYPTSEPEPTWIRGYVVTPLSSFFSSSTSSPSKDKPEIGVPETSVSIGIFPLHSIHVRGELENEEVVESVHDSPRRSWDRDSFETGLSGARLMGKKLPMGTLAEEEEDEDADDEAEEETVDRSAEQTLSSASGKEANLSTLVTATKNTFRRSSLTSLSSFDFLNLSSPLTKSFNSPAASPTSRPLSFTPSRKSNVKSRDSTPIAPTPNLDKPTPLLPQLQNSDNTTAGALEPLIDEISCAVREWNLHLYDLLHRGDYSKFGRIKSLIEDLSRGRQKLIDSLPDIGSGERRPHSHLEGDLVQIRRECIKKLGNGNWELGLEVIVRHPVNGGLVHCGTAIQGEGEDPIDRRSWVTAVQMYAMQVEQAYSVTSLITPAATKANFPRSAPGYTSQAGSLSYNSALPLPFDPTMTSHSRSASTAAPVPHSLYHISLDLKAFVANICVAGETAELYFSLYSTNDSRFLSEEFCLILDEKGNVHHSPEEGEGDGNKVSGEERLKCLFKDLTSQEVVDHSVYLVCRIVKNGNLKLVVGQEEVKTTGRTSSLKRSGSKGGLLMSALSPSNSTRYLDVQHADDGRGGGGGRPISPFSTRSTMNLGQTNEISSSSEMLRRDTSGNETYRRPFGCCVLELSSQFHQVSLDTPLSTTQHYHMPIFMPTSESTFSTMHEDIISNRLKELEKSPWAQHLAVRVRILFGDLDQLEKTFPSLARDDITRVGRLGFEDVVFPGMERNQVYLKLWSGDFSSVSGGGISGGLGTGTGSVRGRGSLSALGGANKLNVEVEVVVRTKDGLVVENVIGRGEGEERVSKYTSMVFRANNTPTWGELVKLDIPISLIESCHLFFTFRARGISNRNNLPSVSTTTPPFAFAFLPFFLKDSTAFVPDGSHSPVLYKFDSYCATPQFYLQAPSVHVPGEKQPHLAPAIVKTLIPLKDTFVVRSFLVSTKFTQDTTLLKLLDWQASIGDTKETESILRALRFCTEVEICKFLRNIFDALFGILSSPKNPAGDVDDLVFQALVNIVSIVFDRRFTNFKPVLELYIEHHFDCAPAASHLIRALQKLIRNPIDDLGAEARSSIKVIRYIFAFIIKSRELQQSKSNVSVLSSYSEATFKRELLALLAQINSLMRVVAPSSIIGTQTLMVQQFTSIIPDLLVCFTPMEAADIAITFVDSIAATRGKITLHRLILLQHIVRSVIFESPTGRAALVPRLVRWIKVSLGKFDERSLLGPSDTPAARDLARVGWIEGIRIATGVLAAALDAVQRALVDPELLKDRALRSQEEDNVEYLLGIIPQLIESFREVENGANLESIERQRTTIAVVPQFPPTFPSNYPVALLSRMPVLEGQLLHDPDRPTLQGMLGELACVFMTLLSLPPPKIFKSWLDATLEVVGEENFVTLLIQIFQTAKSILANEAYPSHWLNINIFSQRVIVSILDPISDFLSNRFMPSPLTGQSINLPLWQDFFSLLLAVLTSSQLCVDEFPPQKKRSAWSLAGDLRAEGAVILARIWRDLGEHYRPAGIALGRYGGHQGDVVPTIMENILSLSLSRHDELRGCSLFILYSMIVNEFYREGNIFAIEAEIIDQLDHLFMQHRSAEAARAFFVGQLRSLFNDDHLDPDLRLQIDSFLASLDAFLDLLLIVANLPAGEEYQEDRIISTLRLMSFVRGMGRSEMYIRYVNRLVSYHVSLGHETEAGLTLKLWADLHTFNTTNIVVAVPDLNLPRQTEFARKESLYLRILAYLSKGKAWETALAICKELQSEYETNSFDYTRLSDLLILQAELYSHILHSDRQFGAYFRVAFYGAKFPPSVIGKQYIYRGNPDEELASFADKMLAMHPTAQLLTTSSIPTPDIQHAPAQYLQITSVEPQPDLDSNIFVNLNVPDRVRAYFAANETRKFCFTRLESRSSASGIVSEMMDWKLKTILVSEDAFPTVLRRSEVTEIEIIEISPLESAIKDVEKQQLQLARLNHQYRALLALGKGSFNTTPLSRALDSAVDSQSVPTYRRHFLRSGLPSQNAQREKLGQHLAHAISQLTLIISRCLRLHAVVCPPEMSNYHKTLEGFFHQHFRQEIALLPPPERDSLEITSDNLDTITSAQVRFPSTQSPSATPSAVALPVRRDSIKSSTVPPPTIPNSNTANPVKKYQLSDSTNDLPKATQEPAGVEKLGSAKRDRRSVLGSLRWRK